MLLVNPLSFKLHREEGCKQKGKERTRENTNKRQKKTRTNLLNLFFVDDVKLYAGTL